LWGQTRLGIWRDAAIAVAVGVGVALFATAAVNSRPTPQAVANWHLQNALPQAGANDVVAAIITDFRGTDTLIEITVFGMAALGVLTLLAKPEIGERARKVFQTPYLLRRIRARVLNLQLTEQYAEQYAEAVAHPAPITAPSMQSEAVKHHTPVEISEPSPSLLDALTRVMALLTLPFALLIAMSHLLYAGSAPGDGFTAGVIAGLGVALWYIIYGYTEAKKRLKWVHPVRFVGLGLFIALTNAVLPLLFGREFLAFTLVQEITLPADIKLASPLLFEIGIFFAVFGGASAIMEAITHPKEVESM
jgi:multicomponent K+:H+ antiporter subunit A